MGTILTNSKLRYNNCYIEEHMIKDKEIAQNISRLMLDISARLNDSLIEVQEKCSKDEFEK